MLTLDIKQHFISCYGVTTTSYKRSFQKCHSQTVGYEAYHIDIVYCRSQSASTDSVVLQLHRCNRYVKGTVMQTLDSVSLKAKRPPRNLLAHLMRP